MNIVDVLLVAIILFSIFSGYRRGFITGALELVSWVAGLVITFLGYKYVSDFLLNMFPKLGVYAMPLSFILLLILTRIILGMIVNAILSTATPGAHTTVVNRFLGIIPGIINGLVFAAIIATLLTIFPLADGVSAQVQNSQIAGRLTNQVEGLEDKLAPVFNDAVKKSMGRITVEPESEKTINLPFKSDDPKIREDLEAQMLVLVNEERRKAGLKPVVADPEMREVARAHSKDMLARGYFSHITPEGKDPFDRMRAMKVSFLAAGENLAFARTLRMAHTGLMNSPGHRANILQKAYRRLGIGIQDAGMYGLMITQNFRN